MSADRFSLPQSEFVSFCGSLLTRLQNGDSAASDASAYLQDLQTLRSLIAHVCSPAYLQLSSQIIYFVRDFLPGSLSALFARPITAPSELDPTIESIRDYITFVLFHLKTSVPSNAPAIPTVEELPSHLVSPPLPPAFPPLPTMNNANAIATSTVVPSAPPALGSSSLTSTGGMVDNPLQTAVVMVAPGGVAEVIAAPTAEPTTAAAAPAPAPAPAAGSESAPAASTDASKSSSYNLIPSQASATYVLPEPFPQDPQPTTTFIEFYRGLPVSGTAQLPPAGLKDLDNAVFDLLDSLFDDTKSLYQRFAQDRSSSTAATGTPAPTEETAESAEWRTKLSASHWVDFFHNGKWKCGEVADQRGSEGAIELLVNSEALSGERVSDWIPRNSNRLAPIYSRTAPGLDQWRRDLVVDSNCDALDTVNKWYTSNVVEVRPGAVKINYDGWSSRYDEWLPITSDRLAAHKSKAQGGQESGGVVGAGVMISREFDDSTDPEDQFAVFRGKEWGSYLLTENVNTFGSQGGFDLLIKRIVHRSVQPLSVPQLKKLLDSVARGFVFLSKPFLKHFLPLLRLAVFDTLLDLSDVEMRELSKEILEEIVKSMEKLLKRVMTSRDMACYIDKFNLYCALKRFRSPIVQRRVNGMAFFQESLSMSSVKRYTNAHWLSPPSLIYFIRKNGVLEECYGLNGHQELMKRTADILKFFAQEQRLSRTDLDLVWNAMEESMKQKDDGRLQTLYGVLDDIALYFDNSHVDYLFDRVQKVPFQEYQLATLDLIREITKYTHRCGPTAVNKATNLLWQTFQDESNAPIEVAAAARAKLEDILKSRTQIPAIRLEYMELCVESLKNSRSVPQVLVLLKQLIECFSDRGADGENAETLATDCSAASDDARGKMRGKVKSRAGVIQYLDSFYGMLDAFFADLKHFKSLARSIASDQGSPLTAAFNTQIISSRAAFIPQLKERFSFLLFLMKNSFLSLSPAQVDLLWHECNISALTADEREIFLRYLRLLIQEQNKGVPAFSAGLPRSIFHDKLIAGIDYNTISIEHWNCFEAFFLHVNSVNQHILLPENSDGRFTVLVFQFEGVEEIWRVSLQAVPLPVVQRAITFLNELHENLADTLKPQLASVRQTYIDHCMKLFGEYSKQGESQRALRCLSLIHQLLDQSEVRGIGSFRAHATQTRGRLLHLTINQSVSKDKPNRIPIKAHANDTLFELREQVGEMIGISTGSVKLFANGQTLSHESNSKSLRELKIRDQQTILVSKRVAPVQQADLLDANRQVTRLLRAALVEIFTRYAFTDGAMSKQDLSNFFLACGAGEQSANSDRMNRIFNKYADPVTKYEIMTCEGFIEFYREASVDRPEAVWNDLKVNGWRRDLKKESEVAAEEKRGRDDEKTLPRYLLASNADYLQQLFEALNSESSTTEIESSVWQLLQRLPTNPALYADLHQLDAANPEWNSLLNPNSLYRLLYALQILESLTEPIEEDEEKDAKLEERDRWSRKFLSTGGFKHLYEIFLHSKRFESQIKSPNLAGLQKKCSALLLKMLLSFLLSAMSAQVPAVNSVQRIRSRSIETISEAERAQDEKLMEAEKEKDKYEEAVMGNPMMAAYMNYNSSSSGSYGPKSEAETMAEMMKVTEAFGEMRVSGTKLNLSAAPATAEPASSAAAGDAAADSAAASSSALPSSTPSTLLLGRQMSLNFSSEILSTVDFPLLFSEIWNKFMASTAPSTLESVDGELIEPALNAIVALAVFDPRGLIPELYKRFESDVSVFSRLATHPGSEKLRQLFVLAVCELVSHAPQANPAIPRSPLEFFLGLALKFIPLAGTAECDEYFSLLIALVQEAVKSQPVLPAAVFSLAILFDQSVSRLRSHVTSEPLKGDSVDKLLCGLLTLITELIRLSPDLCTSNAGASLVDFLFTQSLFSNSPQCCSPQSRGLALDLLLRLVQSEAAAANFLRLLHLFRQQRLRASKLTTWEYSPDKQSIASVGYVGLRNLGATCYMNSLLQQFFMIPKLRYGLLAAQDSETDKKESLLFQLQNVFAHLAASEKQICDTSNFVHTYKDESGQPINPRIQQDAQEFFNVLCDRIEKRLKGTPHAKLIQHVFGGKLVNQVICHGGCTKDRERDEDFYCVSLQVKDCTNMKDSLEKYVLGEKLSDFNCDACGKKTEITKRAVIGKLSRTMIFHLKRFELNWQTFQHEKLNNRFEFPQEIDLEPFTKEGLHRIEMEERAARGESVSVPAQYSVHPKEYYRYKLFGILVHTGSASGGHYFSYIKERKLAQAAEVDSGDGRWLEFNDNTVRPFDPNTIDENCFGGHESTERWGNTEISSEKIRNAYMLVYERVAQPAEQTQEQSAVDESGVPVDYHQRTVSDAIPSEIFENIRCDNLQFYCDRQVFNPAYFNFVKEMLRSSPFTPNANYSTAVPELPNDSLAGADLSLASLQLITQFCIDSLIRSTDNKLFQEFVAILQPRFLAHVPASCWLLNYFASNAPLLGEILLIARDAVVRKGVIDLLVAAATAVAPFERSSYISESGEGQFISRYLHVHLGLFNELGKNWVRFAEYFQFLDGFAAISDSEAAFLHALGLLTRLPDFMLGEASPIWDKKTRRPQLGSVAAAPDWSAAIRLVDRLMNLSKLENAPFKLSDSECAMLAHPVLYRSFLQLGQATESCVRMAISSATENLKFSESLIESILTGLSKTDSNGAQPYFDFIAAVVKLGDSIQANRWNLLTAPSKGILYLLSSNRHASARFTYLGIKSLISIIADSEAFGAYLMERRPDWAWMDQWLNEYITKRAHGVQGKQTQHQRQQSRSETFQRFSAMVEKLGGQVQAAAPPSHQDVRAQQAQESDSEPNEAISNYMAESDTMSVSFDNRKRRMNGGVGFPGPYNPKMLRAMEESADDDGAPGVQSPQSHMNIVDDENDDDVYQPQIGPRLPAEIHEDSDGDGEGESSAVRHGADESADAATPGGDADSGQSKPNGRSTGNWECQLCTYHNPHYFVTCEMCDAPKPS